METFKEYRRKQIAELRPVTDKEVMSRSLASNISVSPADKENGSPLIGDMVARNPKNHNDQWLVAKQYFEDNFEVVEKKIELRPSVLWFAEQMEKELRANDHKGGWKNCTLQYLSSRLTQERKELYEKLDYRKGVDKEGTISECADVANFALMIADKFGENFGG